MSDPAVEAARAAFLEQWPEQGEFEFRHSIEGQFGREAAREALKPLRHLHFRANVGNRAICNEDGYDWPCNTAKLVYSSEELGEVGSV